MTEYQAQTGDGEVIDRCPQGSGEQYARLWFRKQHEPKGAVLVLCEWETEAEADRARLDWIQEHGFPMIPWFDPRTGLWFKEGGVLTDQSIRAALDAARNAPQPKVTRVAV